MGFDAHKAWLDATVIGVGYSGERLRTPGREANSATKEGESAREGATSLVARHARAAGLDRWRPDRCQGLFYERPRTLRRNFGHALADFE